MEDYCLIQRQEKVQGNLGVLLAKRKAKQTEEVGNEGLREASDVIGDRLIVH